MTITAAKLAVEIGADTRNAEEGMRRVSRSLDRFAGDSDAHLGRAGGAWGRLRRSADDEMDGMSRKSSGMLGGMSSGFAAFAGGAAVMGVTSALSAIGDVIVDLGTKAAELTLSFAQAAMDWQSQFTAVKKTVSGTPEQLGVLEGQLRALARRMPVSHQDLAKIAETAGQLGVPTANIADFTEQIAMLATATDMTADQAATAMGKFVNIMGTPMSKIGNLGASLVALGNDGASTESDIMDMSLRLAAAGKQVRLSEGQVMGLASALSSVGIDAEAGGTAFSRVLVGMNQAVIQGGAKLAKFAQVSGMSAGEFARRWKADPTQALDAFLKGLRQMSDQGLDVDQVLEDLDFNDVRVTDALKRASSAGDMFGKSIRLGQQAMSEGTAARDEYAQFAATTASKVDILKNRWNDFKISLGQQILNWAQPYLDGFMGITETIGNAVSRGDGLNGILEALAGEHSAKVAAAFEKIVGIVQIAGAVFWGLGGVIRVVFGTAQFIIADLGSLFGQVVEMIVKGISMLMRQAANVMDAIGMDSWANQLRQIADTQDSAFEQLSDAMTGWSRFAHNEMLGGFRMLQEAENMGAQGMAHYRGEVTNTVTPVGILGNQVSDLAKKIFGVPDRNAQVTADIGQASGAVAAIRNAIATIPDRTVTVWVKTANQVGSTISNAVSQAIGRRARGGPVQAGGLYVVGERGPELVEFGAAGYVTPNDRARQAIGTPPAQQSGSGGPVTVVLEVDRRRLGEVTLDALNLFGGESTARLKVS